MVRGSKLAGMPGSVLGLGLHGLMGAQPLVEEKRICAMAAVVSSREAAHAVMYRLQPCSCREEGDLFRVCEGCLSEQTSLCVMPCTSLTAGVPGGHDCLLLW